MSNNQARIVMFAYFPKNGGNPITLIVPRNGEENYEEEEEYFEEEEQYFEEEEQNEEEEEQNEVAPQELPPITSYYQNDYPQPQTNYQPPPRPLTPAPEPVQYQNDYEAKLDDMAGTYNFVSRRDRLKAFI